MKSEWIAKWTSGESKKRRLKSLIICVGESRIPGEADSGERKADVVYHRFFSEESYLCFSSSDSAIRAERT
jgi:hypothetical protein